MVVVDKEAPELIQSDAEQLQKKFPNIYGLPYRELHSTDPMESRAPDEHRRPIRVGILLSGGPAPGGHNVICGLYDYVKHAHVESQIFGFLGGLDGLFNSDYRRLTNDFVDQFRNTGGFDMLWSGRGRVQGTEDMQRALVVCEELLLDGLVIVGGDGSNSNAAILAEYFGSQKGRTSVVGIPKTIDGDLRNPCIETSFGFDTCAKTYSELIGNLTTDICSQQAVYHFVRVMGRSASHLVLECALQTRPNLVFIGEEIERDGTSLKEIVTEICDLVLARNADNRQYGIILVPEGLIEFIPEMKLLIGELNTIMADGDDFEVTLLSDSSRELWLFLPENIREQLLGDREATGYIQVAKIATERLLIALVESELSAKKDFIPLVMPHYFGYEGRCAMPSNFDASYCTALGYTAGCLVENACNGYMTVVRNLEQHYSVWQPAGVPFYKIMEMRCGTDGETFPAVTRQLVDLDGSLFAVFKSCREQWKLQDCYRVPGPVQFEGVCAEVSDYTVCVPCRDDLLWRAMDKKLNVGRAVVPKRPGALSFLQRKRLGFQPTLPRILQSKSVSLHQSFQSLPRDPYTHRQTLLFYKHICKDNKFFAHEVRDAMGGPTIRALTVGVIFLSRQSPGIMNVLWGLHERTKRFGGKTYGFYGMQGLLQGNYLHIIDDDLEVFYNQGGCELLGRSSTHSLLHAANQARALETCKRLQLDGLVVVGSNLAVTEATLLAEFFLANGCQTKVVAVPATGSNNLAHELIETNIGFDTSSKVYASLIGNVLTDAASMPKYWHFIRLMGRAPSYEVLECALQTHPNFVIIAEEYGASQKTLADVVSDIADCVCLRSEMGKNFGTVIIPDGLLSHLPNMKMLMAEIARLVEEAPTNEMLSIQHELLEIQEGSRWLTMLSPWNLALFKSLPRFIRKEMVQVDNGEMRFTRIETEVLLSQMVRKELERRAKRGEFNGKFAAVNHFFGYQGRSSLPSNFDCNLAYAYGHLAAICVESGLTAMCCTIRGLVGPTADWKAFVIPMNCMLALVPSQQEVHHELGKARNNSNVTDIPIIPSSEVNLESKAFRWMKTALDEQWMLQDRFCNPGPIQFDGPASLFHNRILHEEQAEYYEMLKKVTSYTRLLKNTCTFGIEPEFLRYAFVSLNSLLAMNVYKDDLLTTLPRVDLQEAEINQDTICRTYTGLRKGTSCRPGPERGPRFDSHVGLQRSITNLTGRLRPQRNSPVQKSMDL
ncbi:MAG: uncharacterized protein KVP18_004812 [Porospora cf. gigantea A]|uniref:uncharacterized protein n=1 Tax=Porospora cf. gigantea A TaxID=2853593 RepID=UPI00355988A6|nr:MAG: hypothetical protein KVP18_004812 [Porospora cf. gigantea A]